VSAVDDVDIAVGRTARVVVDRDIRRRRELASGRCAPVEFADVDASRAEVLDAVVAGVGNVDVAGGFVDRDAGRFGELPGARPLAGERFAEDVVPCGEGGSACECSYARRDERRNANRR